MFDVLTAIATTPPPFLRDVALGVPEDLQAITLAFLAFLYLVRAPRAGSPGPSSDFRSRNSQARE